MDRHQCGGTTSGGAAIQGRHYGVVIGREDFPPPGLALFRQQISVAGNLGDFADLRDGAGHGGVAVAVDHQARIGLADQRGVEAIRHAHGDGGGADVVGDVPLVFRGRDAEVAKLRRDTATGMIADQEDVGTSLRVVNGEGGWLVGAEEAGGCGVHGGEDSRPRRVRHPAPA